MFAVVLSASTSTSTIRKFYSPIEREEYLAQRRDNDPIAKKAFEAEGEREMLNLMRI